MGKSERRVGFALPTINPQKKGGFRTGVVKMLPMLPKVDPIFVPLHFVND